MIRVEREREEGILLISLNYIFFVLIHIAGDVPSVGVSYVLLTQCPDEAS